MYNFTSVNGTTKLTFSGVQTWHQALWTIFHRVIFAYVLEFEVVLALQNCMEQVSKSERKNK